jgi:hypothetical protein
LWIAFGFKSRNGYPPHLKNNQTRTRAIANIKPADMKSRMTRTFRPGVTFKFNWSRISKTFSRMSRSETAAYINSAPKTKLIRIGNNKEKRITPGAGVRKYNDKMPPVAA